jgi:hypothetical protein
MFGLFGNRNNRGGFLGSLFGGNRYPNNYPVNGRQGGLMRFISSPLGQMALMAGASWLGNRLARRRGNNLPEQSGGSGADFGQTQRPSGSTGDF